MIMKRSFGVLLLFGALTLEGLSGAGYADVKLHPLFTDNMVLQREKPLIVWGSAAPAEHVTVQIGAQSKSVTANADGTWKLTLDAMPATAQTAFEVQGQNKISLKNVAVGDVWVCSGQSNMAWTVATSNNAATEIPAANYPQIRILSVPQKIANTPQKEFAANVSWQAVSPQSIPNFSAVGYFFGREIQQALNVPIGLINASRGGTYAEAWTSREALTALGAPYPAQIKAMDDLAQQRARTPFAEAVLQWWQHNDIGTREKWQSTRLETTDWKNIQLPGAIEKVEPDFDGIMWFRREVDIPEAWAGKELVLRLGNIEEMDETYFNGERIGTTPFTRIKRVYTIPAAKVKAGRAGIAVRVYDRNRESGIIGDKDKPGQGLELALKDEPNAPVLRLDGIWQYKLTATQRQVTPFPVDWNAAPNQTSVLFNGMIAPLTSFPVRGVIWYQGEANAPRPEAYQTLFPALIRDWRTQWGAKQDGSEFGFFFVQLANYMARATEPVQSGWAELREAQTMTLSVPRTGMASAIDIGEAGDIHPRNKQDVGRRLALAALAVEYGQNLEYSGPMYKAMNMEEGKVRIEFSHAKGLKVAQTSNTLEVKGFAIRGQDGKWFDAQAYLQGETVVVWNDAVSNPVAVRYAWKNNPEANLVNGSDLPAVPFRTDAP
jgi:sialate O-acetylesterase